MSSSQTNATAVNHHQRNNKANSRVIQRTTSESLRLSMNSNCLVDGNVVANGNTNCSSELTANVDGPILNSLQNNLSNSSTQQTLLPSGTATLLLTNNGKFQSNSTSFVTLPDINMDVKPKTSSYQITSITVGTRSSADEDSADDLDESHTTDENSRVTDMENETPSFSEDSNVYSKDDVFATAYAHGIPIMQNNMSADLANCVNSNQVGKKMSDVRVNCMTANVEKSKGVEIKGSERFKVVKIESIEPFKRGRWTCMDYLDQSAKQVQMHLGGLAKTVATDSGIILNDAKPVKKQGKTVKTEILANQNPNAVPGAHLVSGQSAPSTTKPGTKEIPSPAQTGQQPVQANVVNSNVAKTPNVQTAQVLPTNAVQGVQQQQMQQPQQQQQPQQPQQQMQQQPQQQQQIQQQQQPQTQPNYQQQQQPVVQQAQSLPQQIMSHVIPQMQQNHQMQQATPNAVQHQMTVSQTQLPNFQPQQYSNTSMGGSQSAHNTQTIPMQQIREIHQYQQQYQNNLQNQPVPQQQQQQQQQQPQQQQQYYNQIATDNSNVVYQKPQVQQQQQYPAQIQQFSGQYQQQMPSNQQQFQTQVTMQPQQMQTQPMQTQQMQPQQQMQMSSQQPLVSYPHGQTLPANLQGMVTSGQQVVGLPITSQMPATMVNVTHHQQAMSMGHLPNNVELNMNIPNAMSQPMVVNRQTYIPQQCSQPQPVQHSQQGQIMSQPTSVVSNSMHIQPTNQSYANQNQTLVSNVANVPYSMQQTHATTVMQQVTSQMNSVNQSNVNMQQNYVNSTIPNQQIRPATIVQQTQPVLVKQVQVTEQPANVVVNNPNRTNVISSDTAESIDFT